MAVIVQKYGGSSLADPERIRRCAGRAVAAHRAGRQVLVVVSAMGRGTDKLLALAGEVSTRPPPRELDMLLSSGEQVSVALMTMALGDLGVEAVGLSVAELGILTDAAHGAARILSIDADRLRAELNARRIVVAPGFQGLTARGRVTTLGRGGSDTSAVALAAALGVKQRSGVCEIYTDVDGVYTADPRCVRGARKLTRLSYEEMVELASLGASVLNIRAVMFGQRYGVPIHVRHSGRPEEGTLIVKETPEMERVSVVGCALTPDLARVSVRGLPNAPGMQSIIFDHAARAGILIDDIIQNEDGGRADISFTVESPKLADLKLTAERALGQIGAGELSIEVGLAKISAVGVGMRTHTGVAATMFKALGDAGIKIANITTSEIKISCFVSKDDGRRALRIVHDAFELGRDEQAAPPDAAAPAQITTEAG